MCACPGIDFGLFITLFLYLSHLLRNPLDAIQMWNKYCDGVVSVNAGEIAMRAYCIKISSGPDFTHKVDVQN